MHRFQSTPHRGLACVALAVSICICAAGEPAATLAQSSRGRSSSSYLRRQREQEQAKLEAIKKQRIATLQAQHQAAQRQLERVQPQLATAQGELKSAQSQMESTKRAVDAADEEVHNLQRQLKEVEEAVLANRPADAPDVVKAAEVHQLQRKLDARMHDLLQLPHTEPAETESERTRQSELLHLTADQKAKLKADTESTELSARLSVASKELKSLRQAALESDAKWTAAESAWQAARDQRDAADDKYRRASGSGALARKSLKSATAAVSGAQTLLRQTEAELRNLGARPTSAATAK